MRRWLWPPSRVRARSPSSRSNLRAEADQIVDLLRRLADDHLDDVRVAQAGAGDVRVFDVVLEAVFGRQHAGDAALGVGAVALVEAVLGERRGRGGRAGLRGRPGCPAMPAPMTRMSVNWWIRTGGRRTKRGSGCRHGA